VAGNGLSWPSIARLGLVQVAIGAVVVLMTSTLNRVMVVELGLLAAVPGALVGLHFAVQLLRPRVGFGSDADGRRVPWILGGMGVVAVSGVGAAAATALIASRPGVGLLLAVISFLFLGAGVSLSSTPLLAYLAERVEKRRMAGAAAVTWIMMIAGIIVTAAVAGTFLDPYSPGRLVQVAAGVASGALLLTWLGVVGRGEGRALVTSETRQGTERSAPEEEGGFREAVRALWEDPTSRRFAAFVFVSMLAYSAQDIILEPFAGAVFGLTPGESTKIAGLQHGGVLGGMVLGAVVASRFWTLELWSALGCIGSAGALLWLLSTPAAGSVAAMKAAIFCLGFANGVFAVAAIGAMMGLTVRGRTGGAGLRMGFWGASQAMAYGTGGLFGAVASDAGRAFFGSPALGYGVVFAAEAVLFLAAAWLILGVARSRSSAGGRSLRAAGRALVTQG